MKEKCLYLSPQTEILEMTMRGLIAVSDGNDFIVDNPFDNNNEFPW